MLLFLKVLLSLLGTLIGLTAALIFLRSWATGLRLVPAFEAAPRPSLQPINAYLLAVVRSFALLLPLLVWSCHISYHVARRTHARQIAYQKRQQQRKAYLERLEQRPLRTLLGSSDTVLSESIGIPLKQAKSLRQRAKKELFTTLGCATAISVLSILTYHYAKS